MIILNDDNVIAYSKQDDDDDYVAYDDDYAIKLFTLEFCALNVLVVVVVANCVYLKRRRTNLEEYIVFS